MELTAEQLAVKSHAYVLSFSGYMILDNDSKIPFIHFPYAGKTLFINPPNRLAPRSWRPIPQLTEENCKKLLGVDLPRFPLQASAIPAIGADGTPAMTLVAGRGKEFEDNLPKDTLLISLTGEEDEAAVDALVGTFLPRLFAWLRVLTKQWWIGRPTEAQTGNLHFSFGIAPGGKVGDMLAPRCQQTAPPADMKKINADIWTTAVNRAACATDPPWDHVLLSDISYYYHNREYLTAVLLTCCWVEIRRDILLERKGLTHSSMKTSSTDLLKQVSVGFKNAFGRSLEEDSPEDYIFLKACWISRGHFSHGKPMMWALGDFTAFPDYPSEKFYEHLTAINRWFGDV